LNILDGFSKNTHISNVMNIRPVGAELFHAYIHDAANNGYSKFCARG